MKKIFTQILICSLFSSTLVQAQLAIKEDFIYPAGPLISVFSPNWKSVSGTANQMQVTSPGLSYAGYKTANPLTNKVALVAGNTEDVIAFIDTNLDGIVDQNDNISGLLIPELYYSFLINVGATTGLTANSAAGDYFAAIVPANNSTTFAARVYIRQGTNSGFQLGIKINTHASNPTIWATGAGDNMTVGTTYLLAFRYKFNPGTKDDVAEMWINPVLNGSTPAPLVSSANTDASTTVDLSQLGGFLLRQGSNTPTVDIDAIGAGVSWLDVILPVGLQSFNAALYNNQAQLNWTLPNEQGIKGYAVERSIDGRSFEAVGYVAANSNSNLNYSFADANIKAGLNYYRLKIISMDGTFKYSSIVMIANQQFSKTTLFPNPVHQNLTIAHDKAGRFGTLSVLDLSGKQVMTLKVQEGATQTSIALPVLSAGTYMLVFANDGQKTVSKFVKE